MTKNATGKYVHSCKYNLHASHFYPIFINALDECTGLHNYSCKTINKGTTIITSQSAQGVDENDGGKSHSLTL